MSDQKEKVKKPGKKANTCKATPIKREVREYVIGIDSTDKYKEVYIFADKVELIKDFTKVSINFYLERRLIASFNKWIYFREDIKQNVYFKIIKESIDVSQRLAENIGEKGE